MHIVIGVITALAGLIWALHALQHSGVNLNSFNPYFWIRRRRWEKLYGTKPLYNLKSPMDMAAALVVGIVKQEGDISREQKTEIIQIFQSEFKLSQQRAIELFGASVYLLKDEIDFAHTITCMLPRCKERFTPDQAESLVKLLKTAASIEGEPTEKQRQLIERIAGEWQHSHNPNEPW